MEQLKVKTRKNASPEGKPRVYFTCHQQDKGRFLDRFVDTILKAKDCAVYYTEDMSESFPDEFLETELSRMDLLVMPVSEVVFATKNRAIDEDRPFALEHDIPVMVIIADPLDCPLDELYDIFGPVKFLFCYDSRGRKVSIQKELKSCLDSLLSGAATGKKPPETGSSRSAEPSLKTLYDWRAEADACYRKGDYRKSAQLLEKVLPGMRTVLGDMNRETLAVESNLGVVLFAAGDRVRAATVIKQAADDMQKALGERDPDTMVALNSLAMVYKESGRLEEALDTLDHVLAIQKEVLGDQDPGTLTIMGNKAGMLIQAGRYQEAEKLLIQIQDTWRRRGELRDPQALCALSFLGRCWILEGKASKAVQLLEQMIPVQAAVQGRHHPDTVYSMRILAWGWGETGKPEKGVKMLEQEYSVLRRTRGENDPTARAVLMDINGIRIRAGSR